MPSTTAAEPLRYQPGFETPAPDEAETIQAIMDTMRRINETTFADYGHAVRSVHAKSHGLLHGELRVLPGLPDALAQGIAAGVATYPVVLRISTNPGDILDDSVSAPRGVALKVVGVPGERLPGSEGDTTQDFLLVNGPAFVAADPKAFLGSLKLLARTTDRAEGAKKALSLVLRGVEAAIETVGLHSPTLTSLGGQRLTHPLADTYHSQVPLLHGPYMAKVSLAPVSPDLLALGRDRLHVSGHPTALREAVVAFFAAHDAEWELRVQLCTDLETMPIENAGVVWPEARSPHVPVARITVPRQQAWSAERARAIDDGMLFSPWHGLAAHRPIGGVMRARRPAYVAGGAFRATHNGCPMREPSGTDPAG